MRYVSLVLALSLVCLDANTLKRTLDTQARLTFSISPHHYNRFSLEKGRFRQVFGNGDVLVEHDQENGQIFIKPLAGFQGPLFLSLISDEGHTQDVQLNLKAKAPVSVCFQTPHDTKETVKKVALSRTKTLIKQGLKGLLNGHVPQGARVCKSTIALPCPEGFEQKSLTVYETGRLRLFKVVFQNTHPTPQSMSERDIKISGLLGLITPAYAVGPKGVVSVVGVLRA